MSSAGGDGMPQYHQFLHVIPVKFLQPYNWMVLAAFCSVPALLSVTLRLTLLLQRFPRFSVLFCLLISFFDPVFCSIQNATRKFFGVLVYSVPALPFGELGSCLGS